jgi:hypothetical protein
VVPGYRRAWELLKYSCRLHYRLPRGPAAVIGRTGQLQPAQGLPLDLETRGLRAHQRCSGPRASSFMAVAANRAWRLYVVDLQPHAFSRLHDGATERSRHVRGDRRPLGALVIYAREMGAMG